MSADLLTRLIAAGTPAELVAEVAMMISKGQIAQAEINSRRMNDRVRKAKTRPVKSRDGTGHPVTGRDIAGQDAAAKDAHTHEGAPAGQDKTNNPNQDNYKTPPSEGQKSKRRPTPRTRIASDAQPNETDRRTAGEAGMTAPTFRHEWAKFRAKHRGDGSLMADWSQAWRTWVLKWVEFGSKQFLSAADNSTTGPPLDPIRNMKLAAIFRRKEAQASNEQPHGYLEDQSAGTA